MEDLQRKVSVNDRTVQIRDLVLDEHSVAKLRDYIGDLVEMAYLAGLNDLNITERELHPANLHVTGAALTHARCYVKDKGLRI